jgi:predicted AAA+ superfamily ATPase
MYFDRILDAPQKSFLLLGPRSTGKSTWLSKNYPRALKVDLLESDRFLELSARPSALRELTEPLSAKSWVVIDEIQKIPGLLDEVHSIYEKKKLNFAITGSSARKLKKSQANLLGGRLLDIKFFPLVYPEFGSEFDVDACIDWGCLPQVATDYKNAVPVLSSYLTTYLRQELLEESVIRKLDPFRRFLDAAGMMNGQILNKENLARESGVKRPTIDHYFGILEDTLLGSYVDSFCPGYKTKEVRHPKFYLFDTGVVRACAGLLNQRLESDYRGFLFETFLLAQIRAYLSLNNKYFPIQHYSISQSYDVDFVVMTKKPVMGRKGSYVNIESKLGKKFKPEWTAGLLDLAKHSRGQVESSHIVYCGKDMIERDGVKIWPVALFCEQLFAGAVI